MTSDGLNQGTEVVVQVQTLHLLAQNTQVKVELLLLSDAIQEKWRRRQKEQFESLSRFFKLLRK